jgi:L-seryl-tRNA(Ser) seleniumtransferase
MAREWLRRHRRGLIQRVINATGVLIHTNLGRVPLGEGQLRRIEEVAASYTNLEYDLHEGRRGDRYGHAASLVTQLTGAEDALVVNNNAAAVLLVLSSLCADRDVVISRGELVEIGGEFRIPDVMSISKARLIEVGTTNRTHLSDYERAISPTTAALMKVHASNYKIVGFVASVNHDELARLARGRGVLFIEDLGSGLLTIDEATAWASAEPTPRRSIREGADIVTFSGDKLLGGPQAGIIAGRRDLVEKVKKNPLLRAMRVDKMTLAALQATLEAYLDDAWRRLPLWTMALADVGGLEARAHRIIDQIRSRAEVVAKLEVVPTTSMTGGGSLPEEGIPSWAISVTHPERSASSLHASLRHGDPPIVARIEDDRLLLDLRTVSPDSDTTVAMRLADLSSR